MNCHLIFLSILKYNNMRYCTSPLVGEVDTSKAQWRVRGYLLLQPSNRIEKFQKELRSAQTDAEQRLWFFLRNRYIQGFKFRRQQIVQGYIVDFVCFQRRLIIELDGSQHVEQ